MKIMGLDIGEKRIGIALGDEELFIASNYKVINKQEENKDIENIKNIVKNEKVEKIVYGLPKNMNGTIGQQAEKVSAFIDKLSVCISIPVTPWDERLSSLEAERFLISEVDMSRGKRKKVIDKIAAQIILQGYLDHEKNRGQITEDGGQNK
jgi:putative Holliday junction resolvase